MTKINVSIGMRPIKSVAHTPVYGAAGGKSAHFCPCSGTITRD